jgi:hypothetical protein
MALNERGFSMDVRRLLILFTLTAVAVVAVPAVASAKTVPMRGVVSGSPYGASNGQMAVPVLFSKMTARNAGLKSPVGVIIVKRSQQVTLPSGGGTTLPVNMRTGDRFKGVGDVGPLQQKVFYPRVVFQKAVVYFRSKELSLAELSAAVDSLRGALLGLQNQLNTLRDGSIKAFQDLYAQLADLRNALAALKIPAGADLTSIQSQLDALSKKLNDLIASLPDFSKFALISQLPDLSQYLKISDLTSQLNANSVIQGLQNDIATLQGQVSTLTAQVTSLSSANTTLTTRLNQVCTALKGASVTLDPDGAGPLPPITAPVNLTGIATPCP